MCGIYIIIYIMTMLQVSQHCLFNWTYVQQTVWHEEFIQTPVKMKNKSFSVPAWNGLYQYEVGALQYTRFHQFTINRARK